MPALVRILEAVDVTGTLKQRKLRLVAEGYESREIGDPLFVRDDGARSYVPLTATRLDEIRQGRRRL
jgi:fatty-acyl-CoA synthase